MVKAKKAIKVSQATIDKIKKMGMTAALKKAGTSKNAEYIEGIRRMYGQRRLNAARPAAKSADAARAAAMKKPAAKPVAKSADAARAAYTKAKPATKKAAPRYTSKRPKPMNPKGLFQGLLGGKK